MSRVATACPDWRSLARHRDELDGQEPAGWAEALLHLDRCPLCRAEAIAADPTLLFRRLTAPAPLAGEADEIEAMRMGVATLRAASRIQAEHRPHVLHGWKRWAVAAGLAIMALSLGSEGMQSAVSPAASAAGLAGPQGAHSARMADPAVRPSAVVPVANPSSIEGLNRPDARVYQMDGDHLSVVMIVDESLDV